MQVFKLFLKIVRANIPSSMIYVIVFFALIIPLSKLGAEQTTFEEKSIKVCIFDEDQTEASQELINFIGQKNEIKHLDNDRDKILDALYYMSVDYTFTINKGYEKHLSDLNDDSPYFQTYAMHQSYQVAMMEQLLNEYVQTVRAYVAAGNDTSAAIEKAEKAVSVDADVTYENFSTSGNSTGEYTVRESFFFRYLPYIFISVLINLLCPIMIAFNKKDQRYRINCSCIKQSRLTGQLFMGCGVILIGLWLAFTVACAVLNGMYTGIAWLAVLNSFLFAAIAALIALLVSSFNPSETVVSLITQLIGIGMSFMCGVFVPQSLLGDGVLTAAKFLPAYWYERVNDTLAGINTFDLGEIWMGLGIQAGFIIVLALCVVLVNFKKANAGRVKHPAVEH